jgi:4a-hydroxytetrahydrobiopterin dehydratase
MTGRLTATQFSQAGGVEDWRVIWGAGFACAHFATGSFQAGVALVQAIGELAAAANHAPDIDLRPEGVTVRLFSAGTFGVTERDVGLARQISAAARRLQARADPSAVQHVQIADPEGNECDLAIWG